MEGLHIADGIMAGALSTDFEELRRSFNAARIDTSVLKLEIAPTYACNCRCAYCYEQDKAVQKAVMGADVANAIHAFVERLFVMQHFRTLEVEWYGGEPTLCLDLIAPMSERFISWCAENDVVYHARALSNGVRIGAHEAAVLAHAGIESVLITIDGPEDVHNARRPAVDVQNPFQSILAAIEALQSCGIVCHCMMNADKVNTARYDEVALLLARQFGITLFTARLVDYSHTYDRVDKGCGAFKKPEFDLFTHREYAQMKFEEFKAHNGTARDLAAMLTPCSNFCSGQRNNYFVIDCAGDVYKCDGWMGDKSHVVFNLLADDPVLDAITFDPFEHEDCATCELLSICWGNCSWERERDGWPCHPFKYTLDDYVSLFSVGGHDAGGQESEEAGK